MGFGGGRRSVPAHFWHCPKMGPNIQASPGKQFCAYSMVQIGVLGLIPTMIAVASLHNMFFCKAIHIG